MKYLFFVCQGLSDDPLLDLGGRTPLEAAKTPVMDELAHKGRIRTASFVPPSLEPAPDVACLSILGYDPLEIYTGLAPLESRAFGIEIDDREVIFRADLVTQFDDTLMDSTSGKISEREAGILLADLSVKFSNDKFKFFKAKGYKNYLTIRDSSLVDDLDELDCAVPARSLGQKVSKLLPKGAGSDVINNLMHEASQFLENHEINRVRIDLGENPANRLWLWGQGKQPKLTPFDKRFGIRGSFYGVADFVRGIGLSAGLLPLKSTESVCKESDFIFFYFGCGSESKSQMDLKSKIKRIEEFDVFVGSVLKVYENEPGLKVCVTGDLSESLPQKSNSRNPVPLLMCGEGVASEKNPAFSEKLCGQVQAPAEKSHEFLESFLKK